MCYFIIYIYIYIYIYAHAHTYIYIYICVCVCVCVRVRVSYLDLLVLSATLPDHPVQSWPKTLKRYWNFRKQIC